MGHRNHHPAIVSWKTSRTGFCVCSEGEAEKLRASPWRRRRRPCRDPDARAGTEGPEVRLQGRHVCTLHSLLRFGVYVLTVLP